MESQGESTHTHVHTHARTLAPYGSQPNDLTAEHQHGCHLTPLTEACLARVRFDCLPVLSEWSAFKHHRPSPSECCCVVVTNWDRPDRACRPQADLR